MENTKQMVYKRKQLGSSADVYLNDVPVQIKEEEELIIDDDDVRWSFIGLDEEEFCAEVNHSDEQIAPLNASFCEEDVIEIGDEDDIYFVNGNDSGEIGVSNEPILETSFTIDTDACRDLENENDGDHEVESQNADCINDYHTEDEEEPDNDVKEFMVETTSPTSRRQRRSKEFVNDGVVSEEECLGVAALKELISSKYMKIKCHLCNEVLSCSPYVWLRHVRDQHQDFYSKVLSIYRFQTENLASCKICKAKINYKVNHLFHYMVQHLDATPKMFLCFCDYEATSVAAIQQHQKEKHTFDDEEKYQECPKCHEAFKNNTSIEYHFFASHSRSFWGKFHYNCHLCADNQKFDNNKNSYHTHMINDHKLNNWKILKFRKFDSGRYLQCTECLKIFTNVEDTNKLLVHFLTHQSLCFWTCKYCETKHRFHDWPELHLCTAMKNSLLGKNKNKDEEDNKATIQKLISWNEFEVYVKHICPFCSEEFDKFEDWRLHIREAHFIHTLEGLNMTIIPDEPEKLQCLECLAPITKSAVELHKHRFQHLPCQPYKCRHCLKSLATYNLALSHVLNRCENDVKPNSSKAVQIYKLNAERACTSPNGLISISCPLCNNKRFPSIEEISKHFRSLHNNFQQYFTKASKDRKCKCKICHADVISKSTNTVNHYCSHLHEKPFKCRKCQRSYSAMKHIRKHINFFHLSSDASSCSVKKVVKEEKEVELENAQKSIKRENEIKPEKAEKSIKKEKDVETAKSHKSMKREKDAEPAKIKSEEVVHAEKVKKSSKPESEDKSALYDSVNEIKEFQKCMTYACPECNEPFSSSKLWEHHIHAQHTFFQAANLCVLDKRNGKLKCGDCNLILPDFISRQRQHKLSHMAHTAFICNLCQMGFSATNSLYVHMRKTHFAKCSLKCPLCPKILTTAYAKSEHMKQSHSRREWPSDMCLMCFLNVDDMDSHIRAHHANRSNKVCEICGISYKHTKGLAEHMATKHKSRKDGVKAFMSDKSKGSGLPVKRKLNGSTSPSEESSKAKKLCVGKRSNGRRSK